MQKPTISHINYWGKVNFWKDLRKFWNGLLCRNKSGPFPLLNVAAYWNTSNPEDCAKKLFQILVNNIAHAEFMRGIVVLIGKNKMTYCKTFLSLTRKTPFLCFPFLTSVTLFHTFSSKNCSYVCIHLNLFKYTMQNDCILSSSTITYWKSDILLVKVQSAFLLMEHRTTNPEQILKLLQVTPRNCLNKL